MTDHRHELEFGVLLAPASDPAESVVGIALLAERAGLDLVTFHDHPYQGRSLDTWTLLAFVAARTSRVRLAANVLNLSLRPPAVVARAVASLDILSAGRVELGIGAGAFGDSIEAIGGRRLSRDESVDALEEAIDVIRAIWDAGAPGPATVVGVHHRLGGADRGPAPAHDVRIWVGAHRPRMLDLVGRRADGWLTSLARLQPGDLASGNARIDEAALAAGRVPSDIRRLLNVSGRFDGGGGPLAGSPERWVEELARLALEDGVATFLLGADDPAAVQTFASEVVPGVRETVAAARSGGSVAEQAAAHGVRAAAGDRADPADAGRRAEYERLGVLPTPDDGGRLSATAAWDEATRPHRAPSGPDVSYTRRGRLVGQHLIDVHDMLRTELGELRDILGQVRDGAVAAGDARSALNQMALRQNDWTLGAFCSRYCGVVTQHHGLEDDAIFPHLARSDATLAPVIQRLTDEHLVIHDAIQAVDRALVGRINHPDDYRPLQAALDFLTDSLLSHLSYEELEIVEPLARLGFYPGQV
ncbi:MAG TPA: LLM class flavin-dependent oxidoreductase [Gaiellales bacterium]|nr:LLM class flavin-dependent oxidoreductase [Gaiellales bacterium]